MTAFNDNQFYPFPPVSPDPYAPAWGRDALYNVPVISPVGNGPKGEKGDPTFFKDLTDADKQEIFKQASYVGNKSEDAYYTTVGTNTRTIEIPIADFDEFDLLFVDIEGLDLAEGIDYTISGNSIVLTEPITHSGTKVHFRALSYQLADGNKTILNTMGRKDYNTVAEMQADTELEAGDICHTLGFHEAGDGGAAWYRIVQHAEANGMDIIDCGDVFAESVITEDYVTPEMFGAYGDGIHNDTTNIQKALKYKNVIMSGIYKVASETIFITDSNRSYYTALLIESNSDIYLTPECEIIQETRNRTTDSIFVAKNSKNIRIHGGGTIIGDIESNTQTNRQWGNCIYIIGCSNVIIEGINIINAGTDCITLTDLDVNSDNINIDKVFLNNAGRNCMSLIGVNNVNVTNSYLGIAEFASPYCSLDIEPNVNDVLTGIVNFVNCIFNNPNHPNIALPAQNYISTVHYNFINCSINNYCNFAAQSNSIISIDNLKYSCANPEGSQSKEIVLRAVTETSKIFAKDIFIDKAYNGRTIYFYNNIGDVLIDGIYFNNEFTAQTGIDATNATRVGSVIIKNLIANNAPRIGNPIRNLGSIERVKKSGIFDLEAIAAVAQSRYIDIKTEYRFALQENSTSNLYFQLVPGYIGEITIINKSNFQCRLTGTESSYYANGTLQASNNYYIPSNTIAYVKYDTAIGKTVIIDTTPISS